jgi:hypothetical protein
MIDASLSGGLLMSAGATGNVGTGGITIEGSGPTAPTPGSNFLIGSPGTDTLDGGTRTDTFATNGGQDTINIFAGHQNDAFDLYGTTANGFPVPGADATPILGGTFGLANGPSSVTMAGDVALPGWWSVAPTSTLPTTAISVLFPGTGGDPTFGTSADMATISSGFITGTGSTADHLTFSIGQWDATAPDLGLVAGNLTAVTATNAPSIGAAIPSGGSITGTPDVVVLSGNFSGAGNLAHQLQLGSAGFGLSTQVNFTPGDVYHMLFAYNDAGSTRIADVDVVGVTADKSFADQHIAASDMVQLTGVASGLTGGVGGNVHFLA